MCLEPPKFRDPSQEVEPVSVSGMFFKLGMRVSGFPPATALAKSSAYPEVAEVIEVERKDSLECCL